MLNFNNNGSPTRNLRARILLGTKVYVNFHSRGTYFPGKISAVHQDTYDIAYDDKDKEQGVEQVSGFDES